MMCDDVQSALEGRPEDLTLPERDHVSDCLLCAEHQAVVVRLMSSTQTGKLREPSRERLAVIKAEAGRVLGRRFVSKRGGRALAAPLSLALLALPIGLLQAWLWLTLLGSLGSGWIPGPVLVGFSLFYLVTLASMLGLLYSLLPFAVARANQLRREIS